MISTYDSSYVLDLVQGEAWMGVCVHTCFSLKPTVVERAVTDLPKRGRDLACNRASVIVFWLPWFKTIVLNDQQDNIQIEISV